MSVGVITRMKVLAVRRNLRTGKCDRSCIGILLMAFTYRHKAQTKLLPEFRPTLRIDFSIHFVYVNPSLSCQQLQLFGWGRLCSARVSSIVNARFLEESLDEWESDMPRPSRANECRVRSPIET